MKRATIAVDQKRELTCPMVPNYIAIGDSWVSITDFDNDALERLGALWTRALIARATELREGNTNVQNVR